MECFKCFYSMFGKCPTNGSKDNAACLKMSKSYFDMSRAALEEATEHEYKEALREAAKTYHARMDYIKLIKGEKKADEDEGLAIH